MNCSATQQLVFDRGEYHDKKGRENNPKLGITYSDADLLEYVKTSTLCSSPAAFEAPLSMFATSHCANISNLLRPVSDTSRVNWLA